MGVILPDSVDKDNRELFEQILTQLTSYQEQAAPPGEEGARQVRLIQDSTSERIAAGLVTGIIPLWQAQAKSLPLHVLFTPDLALKPWYIVYKD